MIVDAAVDGADDRSIVSDVTHLRQIGDRQLKSLAGGDIRFGGRSILATSSTVRRF
jgi:hypothetical protein